METNVSKERLAFVQDPRGGHWSLTGLRDRDGITGPTGYKWGRAVRGGRARRPGGSQPSYPLTITDHCSRTVLACHGLHTVTTRDAKPVCRTLFRAVSLPEAIRTDNGAPFASTGIHGLAASNAWWMQLGIVHQRTTPASPRMRTARMNGCIAS